VFSFVDHFLLDLLIIVQDGVGNSYFDFFDEVFIQDVHNILKKVALDKLLQAGTCQHHVAQLVWSKPITLHKSLENLVSFQVVLAVYEVEVDFVS